MCRGRFYRRQKRGGLAAAHPVRNLDRYGRDILKPGLLHLLDAPGHGMGQRIGAAQPIADVVAEIGESGERFVIAERRVDQTIGGGLVLSNGA
jgi:hypothetical protein